MNYREAIKLEPWDLIRWYNEIVIVSMVDKKNKDYPVMISYKDSDWEYKETHPSLAVLYNL